MKKILKKILGKKISNKIHNKLAINEQKRKYYHEDRATVVKEYFKGRMGYELDLENPQTFNEKVCWMKVNWYNPNAKICVDKYRVREYIKKIGHEEILNELYQVWDKPSKIKEEQLPDKFILKINNGCGDHYLCKDKATFNKKDAIKILNRNFKCDYAPKAQEWAYEGMKPVVLCEKVLEEDGHSPLDYKIICNNGKAKFFYICNRHDCKDGYKVETNFYDLDFNFIPCRQGEPNISREIKKPKNFEKMIALAEDLSKEFPFVRVDLYNIDGKIYFGEYTFFNWSGSVAFEPKEYDKILGDMIQLPEKQETPFNNEKLKNSN